MCSQTTSHNHYSRNIRLLSGLSTDTISRLKQKRVQICCEKWHKLVHQLTRFLMPCLSCFEFLDHDFFWMAGFCEYLPHLTVPQIRSYSRATIVHIIGNVVFRVETTVRCSQFV